MPKVSAWSNPVPPFNMPISADCNSISLISLLILFLLNIPSSFSYAVVAGRQVLEPVVLESGNGIVFLPANSATATSSSQPTTLLQSAQGLALTLSQPIQTSGADLGQILSGAAKGSPSATFTPTSSSFSNLAGTNSSIWPSSITFVSESSSVPIVGIAFITTVGGTSFITNTQPKQSLITPTTSAIGQVAIIEGNTTTTLKLASLPTASPLPQASGIQVISESGSPVTYSPLTLLGYSSSEPAEISTNFVEVINGRTTTQGGWWLIGAGGIIDPPKNRPWKNDGDIGVGCIGGPLLCNTAWVDIGGGFGVQIPGSGEIGPPGYPGGPVDGVDDEPEESPPPYEDIDTPADGSGSNGDPQDDPDEKKTADRQTTQPRDKKTASEREKTATASSSKHSTTFSYTSRMTTASASKHSISSSYTSRMTTFSVNTTTRATSSSPISSSASRAQYFINAAVNASQEKISALLKEFDPNAAEKSYAPDVGATPADGGFWVGYNLTLNQAQNFSRRNDILMVDTYTDTTLSFATQTPVAVISDTDAVTLWTLMSDTTSTQAGLLPSAVRWLPPKDSCLPQACRLSGVSTLADQ